MKTMLRLVRYTTLLCFSVLAFAPVYGQQSVPSWISQDKSFKETSKEFEQYWKGKDVHDKAVIRGKGFKQFNRYQWFWSTRTNAQGVFDPSLYL
ncbi:MAG TPA: hypothetical protein PLH27_04515, partial [bacterium]|nr:hypothetical protein [bacterium]